MPLNFFEKLIYNEIETKEKENPLPGIFPEVKTGIQNPFQQTQPVATYVAPTQNIFATVSSKPTISPENEAKWRDYFSALYSKVKEANMEYGTFLSNVETVIETAPNLDIVGRFKMAFSFIKKQGTTKEMLLGSANNVLASIENDRKSEFESNKQKRVAEIESKTKSIIDKQESIKKLTEEISLLQTEINTGNEKIAIRNYCYDSLSTQLLSKIKEDITGISNNI